MAINGELCIYWLTALADNENNVNDKVEFDGGVIPDNRGGVIEFSIETNRTQTQNSSPFTDAAKKPDTGFGGTRYSLELYFNEDEGVAGGLATLKRWANTQNDVRGVFRDGRIGIRNNWRPEFDLQPEADKGYKIASFRVKQMLKTPRIVMATLVLELSRGQE